jgi:hypothetical protein
MPLRGQRVASSFQTQLTRQYRGDKHEQIWFDASASEVEITREGNRPTYADSRIPNTQTIVGFSPTKLSKNETDASAHLFSVDNASAWQRVMLASAKMVSTLAFKIFGKRKTIASRDR